MFFLVTNANISSMECLSIYRERDRIEKAFRILKTDIWISSL